MRILSSDVYVKCYSKGEKAYMRALTAHTHEHGYTETAVMSEQTSRLCTRGEKVEGRESEKESSNPSRHGLWWTREKALF